MKVTRLLLTATGAAGSATANGQLNVNGAIYAVELNYTALPATTDVTLSSGATEVLSRSNSATDETFYPRVTASKADSAGSTLTEVAPAVRKLDVALADGDGGGTLEVVVWVE